MRASFLLSATLSFVFASSLVLAAPLANEISITQIEQSTSASINLTKSTESEPHPWLLVLGDVHQWEEAAQRQGRRIRSSYSWLWSLVSPEAKPPKENVFHLRALEGAVFMSAHELPLLNSWIP